MNQNNNKNKFNRSTQALSNWPFKQIRIDCSNHPVLTQTDKCAYRLSAMWSQQEELMVKGYVRVMSESDYSKYKKPSMAKKVVKKVTKKMKK